MSGRSLPRMRCGCSASAWPTATSSRSSDVAFALGRNEIVGLIGDNGAGKSTLIKMMTGVAPAQRRPAVHPRAEQFDPTGRCAAPMSSASRPSTRRNRWARSSPCGEILRRAADRQPVRLHRRQGAEGVANRNPERADRVSRRRHRCRQARSASCPAASARASPSAAPCISRRRDRARRADGGVGPQRGPEGPRLRPSASRRAGGPASTSSTTWPMSTRWPTAGRARSRRGRQRDRARPDPARRAHALPDRPAGSGGGACRCLSRAGAFPRGGRGPADRRRAARHDRPVHAGRSATPRLTDLSLLPDDGPAGAAAGPRPHPGRGGGRDRPELPASVIAFSGYLLAF